MYDMKALYEAYSVEEAIKLRLEHPEAQIIAGGTDVLVQVREGRRAGKELISIQKLDELRGERMDNSFGSQIRNYVLFPYQLVKDLRSGVETGNVDAVLSGALEPFVIGYHTWRVANS